MRLLSAGFIVTSDFGVDNIMDLIGLPALQDNYIWLLINPQHQCLIVDPGVAAPVLHYLTENRITPKAILLTHHHNDHIGGVAEIVQAYPELPVYGPAETQGLGSTQIVADGDTFSLLGCQIRSWPCRDIRWAMWAITAPLTCFAAIRSFPPAAAACLRAARSKCLTRYSALCNFLITRWCAARTNIPSQICDLHGMSYPKTGQ